MSDSTTPGVNGTMSVALGAYGTDVDAAVARARAGRVATRIWAGDHTVWKDDPTEITNRLGWLRIADEMLGEVDRLEALAADVRAAGYTHALLLGMGGSSLAPEVFSQVVWPGRRQICPSLAVLDSTDPGRSPGPGRTTRSGPHAVHRRPPSRAARWRRFRSSSTFYNLDGGDALGSRCGPERTFVAITDPGSKLERPWRLASSFRARRSSTTAPSAGGILPCRYFGLVPAALVGCGYAKRLLGQALADGGQLPDRRLPGVRSDRLIRRLCWVLILSAAGKGVGRDKVTLITSPTLTRRLWRLAGTA